MISNLQNFDDGNFDSNQLLLKKRLQLLQKELDEILQNTSAFENILRSHLVNEIIEEQELSVLFKNIQKAKKLKRLAQKQKGKHFKDKTALVPSKAVIGERENIDSQLGSYAGNPDQHDK